MAPERSPRSLMHQIEASAFPLKVLEAIRDLRKYLDEVEARSLCDARDAGASITLIAEALGTTRQTIYNRLRQPAAEQGTREAGEGEALVIPDLEPEPGP